MFICNRSNLCDGYIQIAKVLHIHSKITMAGDTVPYCIVTALVPTLTEVTVLLL